MDLCGNPSHWDGNSPTGQGPESRNFPARSGSSRSSENEETTSTKSNPLGLHPTTPQSATTSASETDEEFLRNKSRDPELVRGTPESHHGSSFDNANDPTRANEEGQLPSALELPHPWREAFASKKAVFGVCQRAPNLLKAVENALPTSRKAFRAFFPASGACEVSVAGDCSTGAGGGAPTGATAAEDPLFPALGTESDEEDAPRMDWLHAAALPERTASLLAFLREDEGVMGKCCRQKQRTDCRLGRETLLFHELQAATKRIPLDSTPVSTPLGADNVTTSPDTTTPETSSSSTGYPAPSYFMLQLEIDPWVLLSQLLHFPTHLTTHQCAYYCGLSHFRDRNRPTEFLLLLSAAVDVAAPDLLFPVLQLLVGCFGRLLQVAAPWTPFFVFLSVAKAFERLGFLRSSVRWHWLIYRVFHHLPTETAAQVVQVGLESMLHLSQLLGAITAAHSQAPIDSPLSPPAAAAPEFALRSFDLHDLSACHRQLAEDVARAAKDRAEAGDSMAPITFSAAEMQECCHHLERVRADLDDFCSPPVPSERSVLTLRHEHPTVQNCVAVMRLCKVEISLRLQWEMEVRRHADRTATNLVIQDYCDRGPRLSRQCVKEWLKADRDRLEQLRQLLRRQ